MKRSIDHSVYIGYIHILGFLLAIRVSVSLIQPMIYIYIYIIYIYSIYIYIIYIQYIYIVYIQYIYIYIYIYNQLSYQTISLTRTQGQLSTATPISSFVQCQISFQLFIVSHHISWRYIYIYIYILYIYIYIYSPETIWWCAYFVSRFIYLKRQ